MAKQHPVAESQAKTPVVPDTEQTGLVKQQAGGVTVFDAAELERLSQGTQLHFKQEDVAIPFLRVLQSNSPHCTMGDPKFTDKARPGMFVDTVTNELLDGLAGILVTPLAFQTRYIEWWPRNNPQGKKGLVKDWGLDDSRTKGTTRDEKNRDITAEGTEIVKTASYFLYLINPDTGAFRPMLFTLQRTQLKKSRMWNALIQQLQVPSARGGTYNPAPFYKAYRFTTVPEKNDQGQWMGVQIAYGPDLMELPYGSAIFSAALTYRSLIESGKVKTGSMEDEITDAVVDPAPSQATDGDKAF